MATIAVNTRFLLHGQLEGVGFHVHEILKRLIRDHTDVEFHLIFDRPWHEDFNMGDHVVCHKIFPPARHPILFGWWYQYSVPRLLRKIKPDVFWSPDNFLCLKTNVPTVLTVHDLAYLHVTDGIKSKYQSYYTDNMPRFIDKAEHILSVSEFTKQDIIDHSDRDQSEVTVCYNGCRDYFKPLKSTEIINIRNNYSEGHPYFVYLGSQHPRKNVHRLIQAFELFKRKYDKPIKLIIAGRRAWMTEAIDQAIRDNAFKKDIIMIDRYLDGEEAARLIGASHGLAYPSLFEGFGIPILEGMQCDVPVITSYTSSMPEVGGDAVAYVDPYDISSIADAMLMVASDHNYRQSLIDKSREQRRKFNWDRTADIVWSVLEKYL